MYLTFNFIPFSMVYESVSYVGGGRRLCIICFTPLTQADRFGGFSGVGMRRGLPFRQRWCQL